MHEGSERDSWGPRWGDAHARGMLIGVAVSAAFRLPLVVALVAAGSFLGFVVGARRHYTASGAFGLANAITSARLVLTLGLLVLARDLRAGWFVLAALSVLLLDALDGWLARRVGAAGPFGARYDVEADALLVVALTFALWLRGVTGAWVLIAGLWRYLYVLAPRVLASGNAEAKRSQFGRFLYVFMITTFLIALWIPGRLGEAAATLGTLAVSVSFLRSFSERYRPQEVP